MNPLVTVVIPLYNCEEYIEECVLSVLKQDYTPIEIIVVDDASTDGSVAKIAEYPVCISRNTINVGECKTSERGFGLAGGKYICRLSCDDIFVNSNHISIQVAEMEKHNLDWCYNSITTRGTTPNNAVTLQTSLVPCPIQSFAKLFHYLDNTLLKFPNYCRLVTIVRNPINFNCLMFRATTYHDCLTWDNHLRTICDALILRQMFLCKRRVKAIPSMGSFWRISNYQQTSKPETTQAYKELRIFLYADIANGCYPLWMKVCSYVLSKTIG